MSIEQLKKLHNYIYYIYSKRMTIEFQDDADIGDFGSYIEKRVVLLPRKIIQNPSEWSLFAFLHEIGHIITNTPKMKRYEQEYLATQWALDEAKRIGFKVKQKNIDIYQEYIFDWRERSIKLKAKSVLPKEALVLKY